MEATPIEAPTIRSPARSSSELDLVRERDRHGRRPAARRASSLGRPPLRRAARSSRPAGCAAARACGSCRSGRPTTPALDIVGRADRPMTERAAPILLVEDDESLRRILARHLRGQGYRVERGRARPRTPTAAARRRPAARRSSCSTSTCPATPAGTSCAGPRSRPPARRPSSSPARRRSARSGWPSSASPATCPSRSRSRRSSRPSSACSHPEEGRRSDDRPADPPDHRRLRRWRFAGYLALCDRVRG